MKIYEGFLFYNELDLLEIKLNMLSKIIDKFIIVESNKTFTFENKEFILEKNWDRFKKFHNKIIYIKLTDTPSDSEFPNIWRTAVWTREAWQRDQIKRGLVDADDSDIFIVSDADEILEEVMTRKCAYNIYNNYFKIYQFRMKWYNYYCNMRMNKDLPLGPAMVKVETLKKEFNNSPQELRSYKLKERLAFYDNPNISLPLVQNGYHFSYMGGCESIKMKIKNYAHQQYNNAEKLNNIKNIVNSKSVIFDDTEYEFNLEYITDFKELPEYLTNNQNKYSSLFYDNCDLNTQFVTCCSNDFVDGLIVLIESLQMHNKFNYKFNVLYGDTISPLSKRNIDILKMHYKYFNFIKCEDSYYVNKSSIQPKHILGSVLYGEIFKIKCNQLVMIDSDILCIGNIENILKLKNNIIISHIDCDHYNGFHKSIKNKFYNKNTKKPDISSGLIIFNNLQHKFDMLHDSYLDKFPIDIIPYGDQPVFYEILKNMDMYFMDNKYHCWKRYLSDECNPDDFIKDNDIKLIHYAGNKPWNSEEREYSYINKLWKNYYNKINNK